MPPCGRYSGTLLSIRFSSAWSNKTAHQWFTDGAPDAVVGANWTTINYTAESVPITTTPSVDTTTQRIGWLTMADRPDVEPRMPVSDHQLHLLADAILDIAKALGVTDGNLPLTGPQVLGVALDCVERARDVVAAAAELAGDVLVRDRLLTKADKLINDQKCWLNDMEAQGWKRVAELEATIRACSPDTVGVCPHSP